MKTQTFPTIQLAIKAAVGKTGATKVIPATDGVNLVMDGFNFFGIRCFHIYKTFTSDFKPAFLISYTSVIS